MTPKEREVMQQALEALEEMFYNNSTMIAVEKYNTAHNALREALAEQAEQEQNSMFIEGYRIGLAEMREKCAKSVYDSTDWAHEERDMVLKEAIAAAIRAINFEGDTGFRPVSEMIAEHKQDPKKAAAIEKAKMRKAEQKPVAVVEITYGREPECYVTGNIDDFPEGVFKLYAAPVQPVKQEPDDLDWITPEAVFEAKLKLHGIPNPPVQQVDLTDDEIERALDAAKVPELPDGYKSVDLEIARAVIAADREKNK